MNRPSQDQCKPCLNGHHFELHEILQVGPIGQEIRTYICQRCYITTDLDHIEKARKRPSPDFGHLWEKTHPDLITCARCGKHTQIPETR